MKPDLSFTYFRNYEYRDINDLFKLLYSMLDEAESEQMSEFKKIQLYKDIDELHAHILLELGSFESLFPPMLSNYEEVYEKVYKYGERIKNLV